MIADQWCETSWRAQPGSFVSLMTLYESNFVRLGWLVRDLRAITTRTVSRSPRTVICYLTRSTCPAIRVCSASHMNSTEGGVHPRSRSRSVRLSRRATGGSSQFSRVPAPSQLARLQSGLKRELDQRWTRNMMLNKWLEYCAERGHRF